MSAICRMALAAFMGLALSAALASQGVAQQPPPSVQQQLVGTWLLDSAGFTGSDNKPVAPPFTDTTGILIFDSLGNFSFELMSHTSASPRVVAYFGTYLVNPGGQSLALHVVRHSLFPGWDGTVLQRNFTLAGNNLTFSNPMTSWNTTSALNWHRAR